MWILSQVTKLQRRDKFLVFGALLLLSAAAAIYQISSTDGWIGVKDLKPYNARNFWRKAKSGDWVREEKTNLSVRKHLKSWKPRYKGRVNLHVFEDWCGKTIAGLRKNPHYPLYPHFRTTVLKLAVSPKWTNYGLRIFGYLHPYTDGEFVFALSSQDNSELWLSTDDSPLNVQLQAWVGKTGGEWTAPGEFDKYISQISRPVRLSTERKYFFELLHKQDHEGTDHVEVAWQLQGKGSGFTVIESKHISLYADEAALVAGDIAHIPLTAASNQDKKQSSTVDMLVEDPRDVLYKVPLINSKFLQDIFPACDYNPSYTIKGGHVGRYQGLQYVKLSYIYPNDHTRLTHMETEESCFYPSDMQQSGFVGYMALDGPEPEKEHTDPDESSVEKTEKEISPEPTPREYETDYDSYAEKFRKILLSLPLDDSDKKNESVKADEVATPDKTQAVAEGQRIVKRSLKLLQVNKFSPEVNWKQTFQINQADFRGHKSDAQEEGCKYSGSMLISSSEALQVVKDFMESLNKKHDGQFTLVRVVNVVMRVDPVKGKRYLLELLLKDANGQPLRLSQYVYALTPKPEQALCNPAGFSWNPDATVHVIVPVKNQARWVYQLILEFEKVFKETGDTNFNLIVTDYESTDMDIEKALKSSSLHRYQYLKLKGNFQRSAGLQAGVNLVKDENSIVFLCDLHLQFPSSIIDSIRKHCAKGYMTFAPMVMRLDCGVSPAEAIGFWETAGFGLLGIYKSDLDAVGGMNTQEFTDHWGGEDWELLDRIIKSGLDVDRIYLRNFFHYFHSKRGMWTQNN